MKPSVTFLAFLVAGTPLAASAVPIYALTSDPPSEGIRSNDRLIKIDSERGSFETIGRPGQGFDAIAFSGDGRLLATDDTTLFSLNTQTAQPTEIGAYRNFFTGPTDAIGTLTEGDSKLYGLGGFAVSTLQTLNPDTGEVTSSAQLRPDTGGARRAFGISGGSYDEESGKIFVNNSGIGVEELYSFSTDILTDDFGEEYVNGDFLGRVDIDASDGGNADSPRFVFGGDQLLSIDNNGIYEVNPNTLEASLVTALDAAAGDPYAVAFNGQGLGNIGDGDGDIGNGDGDLGNGDGGLGSGNMGPPSTDVPEPNPLIIVLMATLMAFGLRQFRISTRD